MWLTNDREMVVFTSQKISEVISMYFQFEWKNGSTFSLEIKSTFLLALISLFNR